MAMKPKLSLLSNLEKIAADRDHVGTSEYGRAIGHADHTIRKNYCETGEAYGIRPVKVGGRLLWPVKEIAALLKGGA